MLIHYRHVTSLRSPLPFTLSSRPRPFDVLIIGAGAAGLYSALCVPGELQIGLITKDTPSLSASDWAQGGIAAVVDPNDSPQAHLLDTLRAGANLCDYSAVKFLVEQAPQCIQSLVDMGVAFDRHNGTLALTLEAAHSHRRVLHAADTTGRAVVSTLTMQVLNRKNIQVIPQALTLDLWLEAGRCRGVSVLHQGQVVWLAARAVILATGGGGQVFAQTTNPELSTGDGVAIAHRAGATLRDLEFVQFHPTALTQPGAPRFLISEAVRGEGAHLVDDHGRRFAFDYHPSGELAPRDVVSRAIYSYLQKTKSDPTTAHVWLDLRPIPPAIVQHRFPNIMRVCQQWGVDVMQAPIPVAPAAHYWMGGIHADLSNRTSIPGLYAVGEVASTGVHGANRLASNSLLECLVFGAQFANLAPENPAWSADRRSTTLPLPAILPTEIAWIRQLRQDLPRLVWQSAGICRAGNSMGDAIAQLQQWQQTFTALSLTQSLATLQPEQSFQDTIDESTARLWSEMRNLLDIARLILQSASLRTESRGGHYRIDYPDTEPDWQVHSVVQGDRWSQSAVESMQD